MFLTLDYDNKIHDPSPRAFFRRVKRRIGEKPDKVRVSSSGGGLHLIYHNEDKKLTDEEIKRIREDLDDEDRYNLDHMENLDKPKQILWDSKIVDGVEFKASEINPDHLKYIRLMPRILKYRGLNKNG